MGYNREITNNGNQCSLQRAKIKAELKSITVYEVMIKAIGFWCVIYRIPAPDCVKPKVIVQWNGKMMFESTRIGLFSIEYTWIQLYMIYTQYNIKLIFGLGSQF